MKARSRRAHNARPRRLRLAGSRLFPLTLLLVCFAAGILFGFFLQRMAFAPVPEEIRRYIAAYTESAGAGETVELPVWEVFFLYFRYPVILFLLGWAAIGVVAVPLLCAVQGFSLSFSIGCFASALGRQGVVMALAAFGIRALFTLPCTLTLGCTAFPAALCLARGVKPPPDETSAGALIVCVILLVLGAVLELTVVPHLLSAAFFAA